MLENIILMVWSINECSEKKVANKGTCQLGAVTIEDNKAGF